MSFFKILLLKGTFKSARYCFWILHIMTSVRPEIFQGRENFVELGHFVTHFVNNTKKGPTRKKFGAFFLDTVKTIFKMKHLTQRWTH